MGLGEWGVWLVGVELHVVFGQWVRAQFASVISFPAVVQVGRVQGMFFFQAVG